MESDLIIHKQDNVYVRIECFDDGIYHELSEYFTFFVPGYRFMPSYKNKIWDGKIRLFNIRQKTLYKGLTHVIENFCKEREYHYTYSYDEYDTEISLTESEAFIKSLNIPGEMRPYQIEALAKIIRRKRMLLLSPTASGKSRIIYDAMRNIILERNKGIIIVPTKQLVEQLYADFCDYSKINGWDVEENVHRIYEGKAKNTDKILSISTWQSIYTMDSRYFHQFDFVFGDEVHLFKAKSLTYIMSNLINADYRIGLTGSLDNTLTHKLVLEGLFGPTHRTATTKQLQDQKYLAPLFINALVLKHKDSVCQIASQFTYQQEMMYLIQNEARNKFIRNLALSLEGNTLVLYQFVEKHGKFLHKLINNVLPEGKQVHLIHGNTDVEVREEIRKIVSSSSGNIIVASFGTTSTGINIPNLHNIIFASPSKSRIRNLQSIGRLLRQSEGKDTAVLYDIADDLRWKKKENFTLKHFVIRLQLYNSEQFKFKIHKILLKD